MIAALLLLLLVGPGNPPPKTWTICGDTIMGYTHYCQADPKWGERRLRTRNTTMARSGCLITAAAIKATGEGGPDATPETIDAYMDTHNGYTSKNWAKWTVVADAMSAATGRKCEFVGFRDVNANSLKDFKMEKGNFPLLRVRTSRRTNHYVILKSAKRGEIIDPGQGYRRAVPHTLESKRYNPTRLSLFRWVD